MGEGKCGRGVVAKGAKALNPRGGASLLTSLFIDQGRRTRGGQGRGWS